MPGESPGVEGLFAVDVDAEGKASLEAGRRYLARFYTPVLVTTQPTPDQTLVSQFIKQLPPPQVTFQLQAIGNDTKEGAFVFFRVPNPRDKIRVGLQSKEEAFSHIKTGETITVVESRGSPRFIPQVVPYPTKKGGK